MKEMSSFDSQIDLHDIFLEDITFVHVSMLDFDRFHSVEEDDWVVLEQYTVVGQV